MDAGIKDILDLPLLNESTDELTVATVLTAVVAYLNAMVGRALETFTRLLPTRTDLPLELRVVPVDGVRDEADVNPALSDAERDRLTSASDADISAALAEAWPTIADRFYEIHDELQATAVSLLVR